MTQYARAFKFVKCFVTGKVSDTSPQWQAIELCQKDDLAMNAGLIRNMVQPSIAA